MSKTKVFFILLVTISLFYYFSDSDPEQLPEEVDTTAEILEVKKLPKGKEVKKVTTAKKKNPQVKKIDSNTKNHQVVLTNKIETLAKEIQNCQKNIASLFPQFEHQVDTIELGYNEIRSKISTFYQHINRKILNSKSLMDYIEGLQDEDVDPKYLFEQLSNIEDCGDFEEDTLIDLVITSNQSSPWSPEQKKEMVQLFFSSFKDQLNLPLGFHQVLTKIEALQILTEEGFIPNKFKQEMTALERVLEDAQFDYQRSLPANMVEERKITPSALAELKQRERDEVSRLKSHMVEYMQQVEYGL